MSLTQLQQQLAAELQATLHGDPVSFRRVSTDTRSLQPGDLFVALSGPNFDGQRFLAQAKERGAVAAVVQQRQPVELPQWQVSDSRIALGKIAQLNRQQFAGPVFAVTGSSGKTTVKEMLASILRQQGEVLATKGNLNNDIGAPLTLLEIAGHHQAAVIELGASAVGEIAYTVALTRPDVAILNNAMGAHLEGFGSLQAIVRAKGEIFDGLLPGGCAVVNLDDPNADSWLSQTAERRRLTFGVDNPAADVEACQLQRLDNGCYRFMLRHGDRQVAVELQVMGRHNVANAAAAAAACRAQDLSLELIASGLAGFQAVPGRMCPKQSAQGALLIDDSYNANPASVKAAVDVLAGLPGEQRVLVLGDMAELGDTAAEQHAEVGRYAAEQGIDRLLAVGALSCHTVAGFNGINEGRAALFEDRPALVSALAALSRPGVRLLVKGSRSAAMDRVVAALVEGA
ncbi:UDP-N-acetylmuramoyl-tripeptide--D-alanyl-D-alanine ligase [Marinobacterium sp. CAU 1594]|nr:UDP-N-acetylmuramoyl-tripeptide--D-alanyl-D-alanine ligase [Marinobacterium arenosum]